MKGNRAVLTAVVVLVLVIAGWWLFKRGTRGPSIDLIATFATAQKKPASGTFSVIDANLNGDIKQAIFTAPPTRMIWKVRIPKNGLLKLYLGMKPESWDKDGNGVLFFAGVSDGRSFEKLFEQVLNPHANQSERRWIPVAVDLSAYAGEEMDVVLNTRASPAGVPEDARNDLPLWGAPTISR